MDKRCAAEGCEDKGFRRFQGERYCDAHYTIRQEQWRDSVRLSRPSSRGTTVCYCIEDDCPAPRHVAAPEWPGGGYVKLSEIE